MLVLLMFIRISLVPMFFDLFLLLARELPPALAARLARKGIISNTTTPTATPTSSGLSSSSSFLYSFSFAQLLLQKMKRQTNLREKLLLLRKLLKMPPLLLSLRDGRS